MISKITLIGGAPLSGKTTYAKQLMAINQGSINISTDSIRSWMRAVIKTKADYPGLFSGDEGRLGIEEFYQTYDMPEKVMWQQINEGREVQAGIIALLKDKKLSCNHIIVGGIANEPEFMADCVQQGLVDESDALVLVDRDESSTAKRLKGRGLWGPKTRTQQKNILIKK